MRRSRIFLFVLLIIMIISFIVFWSPFQKNSEEKSISDIPAINEAYARILESSVHPVKSELLVEGALRGMAETVKDPYSRYLTKEEAKAHKESLADERVGIGLEVMESNGRFIVVTPVKESPAAKAGVKPYDEIVRVNGERMEGKSLSELLKAIKGEKGTKVSLTVFRGDENRHVEVSMRRDSLQIHTVTSELIEKDDLKIGVVTITMFGEKTAEEWEKHTRSLVKREVDGLLVDVRGNPGGYLHSVEAIASTMLDKGATYAYMQDAEGVLEPLPVVGQKEDAYINTMRKMPLVLLQDEGSASASEVLSGALKSNKRALIAGTKSFGKGTVQETWDLSNGGEIKLSSHKWLTPSQEWIHGSGIKVDFLVESNELFQLNPQISTGTYRVGDYHEDVAYAQKVLKALGHSISRVDGYFDEGTAKAIEQFNEKETKKASPDMNPVFFQNLRQKVVTFKSSKKNDDQLQMSIGYLFHAVQR
ncbi:S41 family peptidase [Paenisporosarcina quisquiliarum]|uniref:S41 family peptidase n=1 Tax=Paenisporosarcina quisquiliarum TaxID=365346 RepID=UPI003735973C